VLTQWREDSLICGALVCKPSLTGRVLQGYLKEAAFFWTILVQAMQGKSNLGLNKAQATLVQPLIVLFLCLQAPSRYEDAA
jgi:hypothetical protein